MLDSLYIKNFRNLKDFKIKSLERVNLMTGKNNTGKSTILEAIEIYATKADIETLIEQLENRGEIDKRGREENIEESIKSFCSLFHNRSIDFVNNDKITIGTTEETLFGNLLSSKNYVGIQIVKYKEIEDEGNTYRRRRIIEENDDINEYEVGLNIEFDNRNSIIKFNNIVRHSRMFNRRKFFNSFQFIKTKSIEKQINSQLWDKITLTDKEQYVINALKIIEPNVERIAFIEGYKNERSPVIKVKGEKQVLPLKSMGDGINRILTIILALVNAEGGTLLIDEFENGLHHTVQEQLWKMIFLLAKELDIQVFATTHSEDCIRGFENVLNDYDIDTNGKLIRLDRKGDKIVQVEFDKEELKVATDFDIEIR